MFLTFKIIFYFVITIFFYRDSKKRGINGIVWVILSLLLCWKGIFAFGARDVFDGLILAVCYFIFYFTIRPKGELIYCSKCLNKKLSDMPYCPHCFNMDDQLLKKSRIAFIL